MKLLRYFVAAMLSIAATTTIYGANDGVSKDLPIDTISLNEVVVTATRNPIIRKLAPALVNVLPHKQFEDTQSCCLAQGLTFVPGVRVEDNCSNCGWTQARINGLDGHYSQILIDSRPLFSALTNVYGLEQLPAGMIDHVEVIRGGGSALFGSSAIGGTINVITKEPSHNGAQLQHTITAIGGTHTFENNTEMNASVVSANKKAGIYIFGTDRYRQPFDYDGDGFSELNKIKTKTIGTRMLLRPADGLKLTLDYHGISDYRRGGNKINLQPHEADIAETTEHTIHSAGINAELGQAQSINKANMYFAFQHTKRNSYYGADKSLNNYGLTTDLTYVAGMQYTHNFERLLFMPSILTGGAEYNSDKINDESIGYKVFNSQLAHTSSVFLQNEWTDNKWSLLLGGRLDKHNMIGHVIVSPRVNIRYTPNDTWNYRFSISGGFRAPQAYDEDLHVDLVNGNRRVVRLADNLKEESSTSWSGSASYHHRFGSLITDVVVEAFYTDLRNTFAIRELGTKTSDGDEIDERYNASGSSVYGMNMEIQASLSSFIDWQAGVTIQRSRYKDAQQWSSDKSVPTEQRMFRTPNVYGYFSTDLSPVRNLSLALTANYTGSMLVPHKAGSGVSKDVAVTTPSFFDANIKASYIIPLCSNALNMQISGGVLNVFNSYQKDFDKGKERDSNYIYGPLMPRSYFMAVKFAF